MLVHVLGAEARTNLSRPADTSDVLDHEKLDVYRCALEFCALAMRLVSALPRGHSALGDQLKRAASSIPLNIAEGAGRVTVADRAHSLRIARGSAMECGAAVDVMRIVGAASAAEAMAAKALLERIVAMLSKMSR